MLNSSYQNIPILFSLSPEQVVIQYTLELVLGFLIPYSVIVVSYICILRRIRKTKFSRRIRSEKLILAIVLTFCLFWLPYHIINMVQVCHTSCFYKCEYIPSCVEVSHSF